MSDQQALTSDALAAQLALGQLHGGVADPRVPHLVAQPVMYAVLGTVLTVVSSLPVAYALAKFRFRGRNLSLMLVIAMMMLPPQVVDHPDVPVLGQAAAPDRHAVAADHPDGVR